MADGTGQTPEQRAAELEAAKQVAIQEAIARFNQRQADRDRATRARIAEINGATTADQLTALNRPVTAAPPPSRAEGDLEESTQDEDLQEESGEEAPSVNGSDPDANDSSLFTPEPNPMSEVYQGTYHFKLYVMNDLAPDEGNQVVIAETGHTALNITSVRIDGIVGPNLRTRNSMATNITIKMTEPFGLNLPDRLVAAARHLNIRNYLKTTFMLQLKFHGYDDRGQYVPVGNGWRWRIMIIDVKSTVTEQGSEHTMTAIPYPDLALQDQNGILPLNVIAEGTTVGEVLNGVINSLNAHLEGVHGYNYLTYKILDVPYPEGVTDVARPFDHKVESTTPTEENERSTGQNGAPRGQFSQGTDIPSLIDNVFSASKTAVEMATLERSISQQESETPAQLKPTSVMHRIETHVKPLAFDPIYGDYQKEITFVVRPYETMRIQSGITSAAHEAATDGPTRLQHAIKRMFLCKQYDYIFTGLNTEVEKFDIELNFRWSVSAPLLYQGGGVGGAIPNYDNTTTPRYISPERQSSSLPGGGLSTQSVNTQRNAAITKRDALIEEQAATATTETDPAFAPVRAGRDEAIASYNAAIASYESTIQSLGRIRKRSLQLGEVDDTPEVILAEDLAEELSAVHPMTIVRTGESSTLQSGVGMSTPGDPTKSVYSTLLDQLYGSFDGNLQTIALDIRGDPYWLGPNSTPASNFDMVTGATMSTPEEPSFLNGEHMFAFKFGLPQGFDDSTNNVQLSSNETYSGFYAVTKVENIFEGGRFTQKLEAIRIPRIALSDLNQTRADEVADAGDGALNEAPSTPPPPSSSGETSPELEASTRFNPPSIDSSIEGLSEDDI